MAKEWRPQVEEWKQKEADARKFGNEVAVKLEKEAAVSFPVFSFVAIRDGRVVGEDGGTRRERRLSSDDASLHSPSPSPESFLLHS